MAGADPLPRELAAVIRFEARHAGLTEDQRVPLVRQAFGLNLLGYRQRLYRAVNHPAARSVEPSTVDRLLAVLEQRRQLTRRHRPAHAVNQRTGV